MFTVRSMVHVILKVLETGFPQQAFAAAPLEAPAFPSPLISDLCRLHCLQLSF